MTLPCLILAAGFGTRMGTLTHHQPKPLITVGGRTLLDHALDAARGTGPITVNAHYRADQIAAHLEGREVTLQHEDPDILDSGGAVKRTGETGPLATLNADTVWTGAPPITQLLRAFQPGTMGAILLLTPRADAVGRTGGGDFAMAADGRLSFDPSPGTYVYTGAQILDPTPCLADPRDIFSLRDIWRGYAESGRLFGLIHRGRWADVGHPQGIALAEEMLNHV